ncbi:MAG: TetR/AcrR family transcriptional regulator [Bacteroidia bacterium]|nr:MAG: TetR/AcrR family transcriptional regulator [Bacteroidia bacterium]
MYLPKICKSVEVRERIIVEAGVLFGKFGIRSMTMDSLAEEMGISKRTIYERFKDKDTLLLEVINYYQNQTKEEALRTIDESDNVIEALFRIMKQTVNRVTQMNPLFFHDFKKYHRKVYREFAHPGEIRDFSITQKLFETGMEQGIFRDDLHMDIVNRALHALFDLFGHDSSLVGAGFDHKDLFEHMIIPYFRGLSTKKGRKLLQDYKSIMYQ